MRRRRLDAEKATPNQRNAVLASFLGWTLDAFDFFIIVFVLKDIAKEFTTDIPSGTATLFLTLAMRPLGAFLFGMMADRFGCRPTLMIDIMFYSVVEFLSGFAPSLTALVILRALYGIAMGGEWGVGASLTMETIPPETRGIVSGLLQAGYPSGYLLAAILYGTSHHFLGWRGCLWSALCQRSWSFSYAEMLRNHLPGNNEEVSQSEWERSFKEGGNSSSMSSF